MHKHTTLLFPCEFQVVIQLRTSGLSQLETRLFSAEGGGSPSPQLLSGGKHFHGVAKWEDGRGTDGLISCLGEGHGVSFSEEDLLALVDHSPGKLMWLQPPEARAPAIYSGTFHESPSTVLRPPL